MCRKNRVLGWAMMSFGTGILLGFCLGSWFWCILCSLSLIAMGFLILNKC